MRIAFLGVIVCLMPTVSAAADLKAGWLVQYQQDSFSGEVFPAAYASEITTDFQKAGLSYLCGDDGTPTFAFYPRGFGFDQDVTVDFKSTSGVETHPFKVSKLKTLGPTRVLASGDAAALRQLIATATTDIAYRQGETGGTFPIVGAQQSFAIIDAACTK